MSFIRPELTETLSRWREVIAAVTTAALGALGLGLGTGYVIPGAGLILLVTGLAWVVQSVRRQRFLQPGEAPGIVRVTEAQIAYLGPRIGGFVSLPELAELRLLTLRGRRVWRLRQADGQMLHIPVEAEGAEALFDAFAALPGMDTGALLAALGGDAPSDSRVVALSEVDRLVWARREAGVILR
jgi:hypothetical protein